MAPHRSSTSGKSANCLAQRPRYAPDWTRPSSNDSYILTNSPIPRFSIFLLRNASSRRFAAEATYLAGVIAFNFRFVRVPDSSRSMTHPRIRPDVGPARFALCASARQLLSIRFLSTSLDSNFSRRQMDVIFVHEPGAAIDGGRVEVRLKRERKPFDFGSRFLVVHGKR